MITAALAVPIAGLAGLGAALTARRGLLLVPGLLVATGLVFVVMSLADGADPHRSGPTGYANASAAVCVAAGAAALQLHLETSSPRVRRVVLAVMFVLLAMPLWFRSRAAGAGALIVLAGLSPAVRRLGPRTVTAIGVSLVSATVAGTVALALLWRQGPGTTGRLLSDRLVGVRAELWHTALQRWATDPVVGSGQFAPGTTGGDDFGRFAHSAVLHVGAVSGGLGVGALLLLVALVVIAIGRGPTPGGVVAALAVTALGLQAGVDYIGHFTVVLVVFAALVGGALTSDPRARSLQP